MMAQDRVLVRKKFPPDEMSCGGMWRVENEAFFSALAEFQTS